jgi:hypothetical protein
MIDAGSNKRQLVQILLALINASIRQLIGDTPT